MEDAGRGRRRRRWPVVFVVVAGGAAVVAAAAVMLYVPMMETWCLSRVRSAPELDSAWEQNWLADSGRPGVVPKLLQGAVERAERLTAGAVPPEVSIIVSICHRHGCTQRSLSPFLRHEDAYYRYLATHAYWLALKE